MRSLLTAFCFLLGLLILPAAAAGPPACKGMDLILALRDSDPGAYEKLVATGAKIANGEGLLWRVEKAGTEPSYLFGTMHVTDDRLKERAPAVETALAASKTVALELAEVTGDRDEQQAMQQALLARAIDRNGRGLEAVPEPDRDILLGALAGRGISAPSARMMRPWMLLTLMSVPGCELMRAQAGLDTIDERIGAAGRRAGARIVGLETVDEQVDALASIDPATAATLAVGMARLGQKFDDVFETLVGLYLRRQTGLFFGDLSLVGVPPDDVGAFTDFMEIVVDRRNVVMAERAVPLLDKGRAFIAVGALHLVGDKGLVSLLRRRGYTVTKVW